MSEATQTETVEHTFPGLVEIQDSNHLPNAPMKFNGRDGKAHIGGEGQTGKVIICTADNRAVIVLDGATETIYTVGQVQQVSQAELDKIANS